jgi:hypothetical protein
MGKNPRYFIKFCIIMPPIACEFFAFTDLTGCVYMSVVVDGRACPERAATSEIGTPAAIESDMLV